jgi:hypothetical protein
MFCYFVDGHSVVDPRTRIGSAVLDLHERSSYRREIQGSIWSLGFLGAGLVLG